MGQAPPIPSNEEDRLETLRRYRILDTLPEQTFDDITKVASIICNAPIAFMSLVDRERQWFKSKIGLSATETPRNEAFCAYAIFQSRLLVVEDALNDGRFAGNPLVTTDPKIRFYAGAPLLTKEGYGLGALCVMDREPRHLGPEQAAALEALARLVVNAVETRSVLNRLAELLASTKQ